MGNPSQSEQTPSRDSLHRLPHTESPEQAPHSAIDSTKSSITDEITQILFKKRNQFRSIFDGKSRYVVNTDPHSAIDPTKSSIANEITQISFVPEALTTPASYIQHYPEHTQLTPGNALLNLPLTPIPPSSQLMQFHLAPYPAARLHHRHSISLRLRQRQGSMKILDDSASSYVSAPVLPLPLDEAIQQLPRQYIRVLARPSVSILAQ